MPDGEAKEEFMKKVQNDYCKRKTTQAWVYVSRDESEQEQVMHSFQFMKEDRVPSSQKYGIDCETFCV
jgi:hypothetical protein